MKNIFIFCIVIFFQITSYSQDTIVCNNGLIVSGTIIESDSLFVSYKLNNNPESEVNLLKKSTVILIKYHDGRLSQLYKNDTLLTRKGEKITAKIIELDSDMLSYFRFDGKINPIEITPLSLLFMYELSNGEKTLIAEKKQDNTDYFALGEVDARTYYKTNSGFIACEFVLGFTCWTGYSAAVGIALPFSQPKLESSMNPNNALLHSKPDYLRGFKKHASKKKRHGGFASFTFGIMSSIVTIAALAIIIL